MEYAIPLFFASHHDQGRDYISKSLPDHPLHFFLRLQRLFLQNILISTHDFIFITNNLKCLLIIPITSRTIFLPTTLSHGENFFFQHKTNIN